VNFPKKKEVILRVEMTQKQKLVAKSIIEQNFEALSQFEKKNNSGVKISLKFADNILMLLRMTANHPLHLTELYGTEIFRQKNNNQYTEQVEIKELNSAKEFIKDSGKLQYLDKMLEIMIPQGHRTLIFTQFISTLDIISDYLGLKSIPYIRLDGQTENSKR
jgi:SNF2 family DNA or RNA helicase